MKKLITLYVCDLDGTLIDTNYRISDNSIAIINGLINKGMHFTYATARSYSSACKFITEIRLDWPVVVYNGAMIVAGCDGEILDLQSFTPDLVAKIVAVLEKYQINPLVYTLIDKKERVLWHTHKQNDYVRRYVKSRQGDLRFVAKNAEESIYQGTIFYFTAIDDRAALEGVYAKLKDLPEINCTLKKELYNKEYFLEIMPGQASKAKALERLKTIRHYDSLVCFGDESNDYDMFRLADKSVAVANAIASLKEIATDFTGSNDDDGVATWLEANYHEDVDN